MGTLVYTVLYDAILQGLTSGRTPDEVIAEFQNYTGLVHRSDTDSAEAATTVGAQTGLSTFIALSSFVLILFLLPPHRMFAAWTAPVADRRPAWLVLVLTVAFAAVVVTPVLSTYFGLTDAAMLVFTIVLPSLAGWFLLLSAVYRFRLLDRILAVED